MDGRLLLVGASAGSADGDAVDVVHSVLAAAGDVELRRCEQPRDLDDALDCLGERTLVVAGGDGTLHVVVAELDRRGLLASVPLGLIPLGTGNDLARCVGIPLDPHDAADLVVGGSARPLDLMRASCAGATPGVVLNAAHAGLGVEAAARAADLKQAVGAAAYPAGAVVAGAVAEPVELRVEVDGVPIGGDASLLFVGVGNGSSVGGGTTWFPQADPADGLLEVVAVDDRGALERLRLALAARRGEHARLDGVHLARGREVAVIGTAAWNDDGELGEECQDRRLSVAAGAWRLIR